MTILKNSNGKQMKRIKTLYLKAMVLGSICAYSLSPVVHAENTNVLQGVKLGFGYDLGFGMTAQLGQFNGFIGNDGLAVDYVIVKEKIENIDSTIPFQWYIGAGGFAEWDGDFGVRAPVGIEASFTTGWDIYVQIIPELEIVDDFEFGLGAGLGVRYQF